MSYCRFSDGDVYMLLHVMGGIQCCACRLTEIETGAWYNTISFETRTDALKHLKEHQESGHDVPDYAVERLQDEIKSLGNDIPIDTEWYNQIMKERQA